MKPVKEIKRVQVDGKKYLMPVEDVDIEKLIQKGLKLKSKMEATKRDLDTVQNRLIEIAKVRREGTTTVTLPGISAKAIITFRENFSVSGDIEDIAIPLYGIWSCPWDTRPRGYQKFYSQLCFCQGNEAQC